MLQRWLQEAILAKFEGRIIPVDTAVASRCAELHGPDPAPERDAMIAATALVHDLIVVTRNVGHFRRMAVSLLNPWSDESGHA
jgi:predicted nucleic acid-binding protein